MLDMRQSSVYTCVHTQFFDNLIQLHAEKPAFSATGKAVPTAETLPDGIAVRAAARSFWLTADGCELTACPPLLRLGDVE
jgi:hypothetical protein